MKYFTHPDAKDSPFNKVEGWVHGNMPYVMRFAVKMMAEHGHPSKSAAEIGVHHGRFFLVLEELCDGEAFCDAFDVFDDQSRNLDRSGRGSMEKFLGNVRDYARNESRVRAFKVDSMALGAGACPQGTEVRYSLFSVDGCHTALHTCNDLLVAERLTSPSGVVIVDDISNMSWMGVFEGVCRYLNSPAPRLAPFAVGLNKLLMAPVGDQQRFYEYFRSRREELTDFPLFGSGPITTHFFGYPVYRYGN